MGGCTGRNMAIKRQREFKKEQWAKCGMKGRIGKQREREKRGWASCGETKEWRGCVGKAWEGEKD